MGERGLLELVSPVEGATVPRDKEGDIPGEQLGMSGGGSAKIEIMVASVESIIAARCDLSFRASVICDCAKINLKREKSIILRIS